MFETYILPVLIFAVLGAGAGGLLTAASKFFEVKTDERIEAIKEALPQINCGACGYSGCEDYANAVLAGAPTNLCKPGGDKASQQISAIMGTDFLDVVEMAAFVRCNGTCGATKDKYQYEGTQTCAAVNRFYNGKGVCKSGCLGLGDCVAACAFGAIKIADGIAAVDPRLCTGCGMCVAACPNALIRLKPAIKRVDVACSSTDIGKVTKLLCANGCIACKICEKKCEFDAIHVIDNHAQIDPEKCTECGACVAACPVKCIHMREF